MKTILFSMLLAFPFSICGQSTISATYNLGDIPTSYPEYDPSCNGPLTTLSITLPSTPGFYKVVGIDISYSMTAASSGWMADQRSQAYCQNTSTLEPFVYIGTGNSAGTLPYTRTNVDIANGTYLPSEVLIFEMRAWRDFEGAMGCLTTDNKVDNSTWQIIIYYRLCPQSSYNQLGTQSSVDTYISTYGQCTDVDATIVIGSFSSISSSDITDLSGFVNLEEVDLLYISHNPNLPNCNGFQNLQTVTDIVNIYNNELLSDLSEFSNVSGEFNSLVISNNASLLTIDGFPNVTKLNGYLNITNNNNLTSIASLSNITEVAGTFALNGQNIASIPMISNGFIFGGSIYLGRLSITDFSGWVQDTIHGDLILDSNNFTSLNGLQALEHISGNLDLQNIFFSDLIGLDNLQSIGGKLSIDQSFYLTSFQGLNGLQSVGDSIVFTDITSSGIIDLQDLDNLTEIKSLKIDNCATLQTIGPLSNLTSFSGSLILTNNFFLTDLTGLNGKMSTLSGDLIIEDSPQFNDISDLATLKKVGGKVVIKNLNKLSSLTGLDSLNIVGDSLIIMNNDSLIDISVLKSLDFLNALQVVDNELLSICCVIDNIYPRLTHNLILANNAIGCNSRFEISDTCSVLDVDSDGILNVDDNCPNVFNPKQQDADNDSIGNHCDNCSLVSNQDQLDSNNNYIGDACEVAEPGKAGVNTTSPNTGLEIMQSDLFINDAQRSLILKNPNGDCYRLIVNLEGELVTKLIDCPN